MAPFLRHALGEMMKPLPLSISDFPTIREKRRLYVDKTCYLHRQLAEPTCESFFIVRPRGFGKPLMISMVCTQSADIALDQNQRRSYAAPYVADDRPVWLIGLSFESCTRRLADAKVENYRQ